MRTTPVAATSREAFVQNLQDSALLSGDDLRKVLDALAGQPDLPDGGALARHLVDAGQLTPYQADAVLQRRYAALHVGTYVVLARLGAGGMGTVYKARHRRMKRVVALKVLAREAAGEGSFAQRFQREVETIAQLSHPNIVMAFDAGETEAGPFLVMEFVNGRDLASDVQHGGPLSVADAVNVTLQAARGLEYAHGQGITHRDVKPANLLREAGGVVKVADLGLARLHSAEATGGNTALTQAGGIVGTVDFMAPEQALDSTTIDARADVYALGCTLYFLLTGQAPYAANSLMGLLLKHRDAPIPTLSALRPEVPADLEGVFRRMVAKKPEERYPTMAAVVAALEGVQGSVAALQTRPAAPQPQPPAGPPASDLTVAADSAEQLQAKETRQGTPTVSIAAAPTPSEVRRVQDLTVVLVEPSRTQAGIVRKYLQQLGIEKVHSTGSGRQALALAKQEGAHVLLSAMHLADMTGVELAQALRAETPGVGFVLASSESDGDEATAVLAAPRTVLLPKPFDLRRLAQALASATGRAPDDVLPAQG